MAESDDQKGDAVNLGPAMVSEMLDIVLMAITLIYI